jgi:rhamnosyltransferase
MQKRSNLSKEIALIAVSYFPNVFMLGSNLKRYSDEVGLIVLVDNTERDKVNLDLLTEINNLKVIYNNENLGIAKAQNIGYEYAIRQGYKFFVELDQDTDLPDGYFDKIINSYISLKKIYQNVGAISPLPIDKDTNESYSNLNIFHSFEQVEAVQSSGMLVEKSVYVSVGPKEEDLFIDLVDWEWCWRAKTKGFGIYRDNTIVVKHKLGDGYFKYLGFRVGIASPIRNYYQLRNALYLLGRNYVPIKWKIKRIFIILLKPIIYLIFLSQKLLRIKYTYMALHDYFIGKVGKI